MAAILKPLVPTPTAAAAPFIPRPFPPSSAPFTFSCLLFRPPRGRRSTISRRQSGPGEHISSQAGGRQPQTHRRVPSGEEPGAPFLDPEDIDYLWKLAGGSIIASVAIKYGSLVFPEITNPNLLQASLMIATPVVISILILLSASKFKDQS